MTQSNAASISLLPLSPAIVQWLEGVIEDPRVHARWLNTLSYLETCGARLIARSQSRAMVPREVLRHAAEEFRHAYYLKSLAWSVEREGVCGYPVERLIGGYAAYHYLERLNVRVYRLLRAECSRMEEVKELAYLLVTYAIEQRAMQIYPAYEELLRRGCYPLSIRGIIREEEHHLNEIKQRLGCFWGAADYCQRVATIEASLFHSWSVMACSLV